MDFFTVSKFLLPLADPGNLLAIMLIGLFLVCSRAKAPAVRVCAVLGTAAVAVLLLLPVGQWALAPLENRFRRPDLPSSLAGVLILGGGSAGNPERFIGAAEIAAKYPHARVVFSDQDPRPGREAFKQLGLDTARTLLESHARNTWENISYSYALLRPRPDDNWVVVSSAFHIPRVIGVARRVGWNLIPWPTGSRAGPSGLGLQFTSNLEKLDYAAHEWVGLLAYWATGRSAALFPAPT